MDACGLCRREGFRNDVENHLFSGDSPGAKLRSAPSVPHSGGFAEDKNLGRSPFGFLELRLEALWLISRLIADVKVDRHKDFSHHEENEQESDDREA